MICWLIANEFLHPPRNFKNYVDRRSINCRDLRVWLGREQVEPHSRRTAVLESCLLFVNSSEAGLFLIGERTVSGDVGSLSGYSVVATNPLLFQATAVIRFFNKPAEAMKSRSPGCTAPVQNAAPRSVTRTAAPLGFTTS